MIIVQDARSQLQVVFSFSRLVNGLHFNNLRGDFFGGLTAAIVALPLALAFGVSSGAGPSAGLYGAIFVGFFAALFGGTPPQVSGPTGPMSVVMATVLTELFAQYPVETEPGKALALALMAVIIGGVFQILLGVLRLGQYITLIPYTVISGFMSGVGVIIILIEVGPLLGHETHGGVMGALQEFPTIINAINPAETALGCLTLAIVFGAPARLNRILPAPLLALILCTLLSITIPTEYTVHRIGDTPIPPGLPTFQLPAFELASLQAILGYGIMLGLLGAIDSLLTSLVADNITRTNHNSDRELIGQGIGNIFSGFFGGLPGAGATMRTVINVGAGGQTPLSGMTHALVLLFIVSMGSFLTEPIPHAVLAGILIKVGIDIIDWSFLKRAHRFSFKGAGLMYLVMFLTVFVNLITAVIVGAFIANLLTIKSLTDLQVENMKGFTTPTQASQLTPEEKELLTKGQGRIFLFCLSGPMSFGAAKSISQRLTIVEDYEVLILDLSEVPRLGITASLAIENMMKDADRRHRTVFLVGAKGQVRKRLHKLEIIHRLTDNRKVSDRLDALHQAVAILETSSDYPVRSIT